MKSKSIYLILCLIFFQCNYQDKLVYKIFPLEVIVKNESIEINCVHGIEQPFNNIEKVGVVDELPNTIIRTGGTNVPGRVKYGNYKLEEIGIGKLYLQSMEAPYIKIDLTNGSFIYINFYDTTETKKLYDYIVQRMQIYHNRMKNS